MKKTMSEIGRINCGKRYSDSFRESVLRVAKERSLNATEASRLFSIAPITYRRWVKKAEARAKAAEARARALAKEKAIKKELSRLVIASAKLNEAMEQLELELIRVQSEIIQKELNKEDCSNG